MCLKKEKTPKTRFIKFRNTLQAQMRAGRKKMPKAKTLFVCSQCGYESGRWLGKCPGCGAWNSLFEQAAPEVLPEKARKRAPGSGAKAVPLSEIDEAEQPRVVTGIGELDRVLGGGIVEGSAVLAAGDPGIGKSTLLLQACGALAEKGAKVLYVTGEESARQIALRAKRLGVNEKNLYVLAETAVDNIETRIRETDPDFTVVDSIQTVYRPEIASAPGSVSQVRESASSLIRLAKEGCGSLFLVGHVTKEGAVAGPRVLEHMVDAVLTFEGDTRHEWRILRAAKNRFGSVNEIGVFEMRDSGMVEVQNPSEMLLSKRARDASGSAVACGMEGTRPLLVDVQALVARSFLAAPRRAADGLDSGRVALLLAVLEKRAGMRLFDKDVYLNVAGGLSLSEPAADLPLCAAVVSSLTDTPLPPDTVIFGEVGLSGEVRAVSHAARRVAEAARLGFTRCVLPRENLRGMPETDGMTLLGVQTVSQAMAMLLAREK